jgi:acyl transferase domain-containing protein
MDEIAIVGVGCRFPGADNLREFWRVLHRGENHVKEIPRERWNVDAFYDPDPSAPGKTYVRKAGFVSGYVLYALTLVTIMFHTFCVGVTTINGLIVHIK